MYFPNHKPITSKRLEQLKRNASSKEYREWKTYVLTRDDYSCQFPMCFVSKASNPKAKLQVHHIKRFADAKHLKTDKFNGVTLCNECHQKIHNKERHYEMLFFNIVRANEKRFQEQSSNNEDIG